MKTKSSCEKGRSLGRHRVEARANGCLMTWGYLPIFGKRAVIRTILTPLDEIVSFAFLGEAFQPRHEVLCLIEGNLKAP